MSCNYTRITVCARSGDRNEMTLQLLKDGDPWDLTGAQAAAHARREVTDASPALLADITPVDSANGIITLSWPGDEVETLLAGAESWVGVWDLDIIESGQTLSETPCGGRFEAVLDVTRVAAYEPLGPAPIPIQEPEPQAAPAPRRKRRSRKKESE